MSERISKRLRDTVRGRASDRCEYCLSAIAFATESFDVEHIVPRVRGGATSLENLALACSGCNAHKYDRVEALDSVTEATAPLFHPRQQRWSDHFAWDESFTRVVGITPTGRATVDALHLNREGVVNLRRLLLSAGLHPPETTNDG